MIQLNSRFNSLDEILPINRIFLYSHIYIPLTDALFDYSIIHLSDRQDGRAENIQRMFDRSRETRNKNKEIIGGMPCS